MSWQNGFEQKLEQDKRSLNEHPRSILAIRPGPFDHVHLAR